MLKNLTDFTGKKRGKKRVFGNLYAERVEKGSAKADF